jgi:hypothetical protein
MLRRRAKQGVLAEIPPRESTAARPGALGRAQLQAFAELAGKLSGADSVFLTGAARASAALGLAAAATAAGRRVALLECDLVAPSLAGTLALAKGPGLHEYLRGDVEANQILQPLVLAGPASGGATEPLTCIVAGEPEPQPVALLDSERCDHAIERLRRAYDLLVIDGPSLEEDQDSLRALSEHAAVTLLCGSQRQIPKRPPIEATGSVVFAQRS